jgi:hypothetical protein
MAERIQLSRRKGWRKPENTVVVARPSLWGNPYRVVRASCIYGGRCWGVEVDGLVIQSHAESKREAAAWAVQGFGRYVRRERLVDRIREALAGKNLACWCKHGEPCHVDLLLTIANGDDEW